MSTNSIYLCPYALMPKSAFVLEFCMTERKIIEGFDSHSAEHTKEATQLLLDYTISPSG